MPLNLGLGTFLAKRAMEFSHLKMYFHESHKIGYRCMALASALSSSMTPEDNQQ